jgi:hypothetical protein
MFERETFSELTSYETSTYNEAVICLKTTDLLRNNSDNSKQTSISEKSVFLCKSRNFSQSYFVLEKLFERATFFDLVCCETRVCCEITFCFGKPGSLRQTSIFPNHYFVSESLCRHGK